MAVLLKKRRRLAVCSLIAIIIGAAFCLSLFFNLLHISQLRSSDFLFRAANLHRDTEPGQRIMVIAIDDKSFGQLGHLSSWPRSHYAHLIDTLAEARARVIVFDILFSEPGDGDEELADSIRNAGNVILSLIRTQALTDATLTTQTYPGENFTGPLEIFAREATAIGHANVITDADGVVRRLPVAILNDGKYEPALALASVAEYLRRPEPINIPAGDYVVSFAGRFIPVNSNNEMVINYIDHQQESREIINLQTVSFVDVLNGVTGPSLFHDKIVIIGATASGLADHFWTPMGLKMNGVEIHASAINTILTDDFLKPAPDAVTMVSILALSLICGLLVSSLTTLWAAFSAALLCFVYFLVAFSFFDYGIMLNMLYPPLAVVGTAMGTNLYNVISERSEKSEVTRTLGRYISPPVADRILAALSEGELKLDGGECQTTTLFADARNFTGISERLQPQELVKILNTYLSAIIEAVLKHDGMINKFGGDSVMAVWNVPVECEKHALFAIKAAISAQLAIREVQDKETTLPKMEFGIGINTGITVAGNMGSSDRLEYSVIGDAVNTAARLADAAPGGHVWIGENTLTQVQDDVNVKPLGPVAVKGKQEPIMAYEILDIKNWQTGD